MNIEPCKICGKMPKIRYKLDGTCAIKCKPFLKHSHFKVETSHIAASVKKWNESMIDVGAFRTTFNV